MRVKDMNYDDMSQLVQRRLNKLAMCKRGVVETDINKQLADLGNEPTFTKAEREAINASLESRCIKAMTPTKGMIKAAKGDMRAEHEANDKYCNEEDISAEVVQKMFSET